MLRTEGGPLKHLAARTVVYHLPLCAFASANISFLLYL
jgi:hypothetical protein